MKNIDYKLGQFTLRYMLDEDSARIAMLLLPEGMETCFAERRKTLKLRGNTCDAWETGMLVHLALRHHAQGNGAGSTLKYGESTDNLQYETQYKEEKGNEVRIITVLKSEEGYFVRHIVRYIKGENGIEAETEFINHTGETVILDMITSFCLDNLSPFQKDDAPYKLKLHRYRGGWSLEGKHNEDSVEELNLESAWFRAFPECERYGGLGSHPVKRWFPFGCVEDTDRHVWWAAQTECIGSWQMELSRDGDCYSLSGGPADCEFGGWWKTLKDGESFCTPKAFISVSGKGLWDVCQNITDMYHRYADAQPECERDLPVIFNEWCTSWGKPEEKEILAIADKIQCLPAKYIVIDAGWSEKEVEDGDPQGGNGDWQCDRQKFPSGLKQLSRKVGEKGLLLGIWMEFEVTTKGAGVHSGSYDTMHLHRNGKVIQTGKTRRFWDFRKPEVIQYLRTKVIRFLKENEIKYLKVDYNGSIGCGCDGTESLGEGLREQMRAVHDFFGLIRSELPDVVIENCASGGHRLEPAMIKKTAMSSFSDAHECREIPYIAANLHQLLLPRQSQIWAVISPELTLREIQYRLTSVMLGRFCLSGDIRGLDENQWKEVRKAAEFYTAVKDIIKNGRSKLVRVSTDNQRHLKGAQVLLRKYGENMIMIYHAFAEPPEKIGGEIPAGKWKIIRGFGVEPEIELKEGKFEIRPKNPWEAGAVWMILIN